MLKQKERKNKTLLCSIWRHDFGVWSEHTRASPPSFSQHQSSTELMIQETTVLSQWKYLSKPFSLNFCTIPSLNGVLRNFILEKLCVFFFPFFKLETKKKKRKREKHLPPSSYKQLILYYWAVKKCLSSKKKNGLAFSKFRDCSWTGKAKKVNDVGMS